jgi:sugar lactone lactonase YvrE
LFLLFCLALLSAFGPMAWAAGCAPVGATPPAPQVTFLRSYRVSFNSPARLAVDVDNQVYVADPVNGRIVVRGVDGRVVHEQKDLGFPNSVAVDSQGRIYVGDRNAGAVTVYTPSWQPLWLLGRGDGEFLLPGDIAIHTASGNVYVTDTDAHMVKVYDATGRPLRSFGAEGVGNGQMINPTGIFVAGDEVLVADHGNKRLQRFDLDGNYCAALFARLLTNPQGIWVDDVGRIYVADAFQGQVVVLDRGGAQIDVLGEFGQRPGQLRTPLDVVMDDAGRLFVSSATTGRVDMFGIAPYTDPERYVPATVQISPGQLDRGQAGSTVTGLIEVPGYPLWQVTVGSITANGVRAKAGPALIGDNNHNGKRDVLVNFDGDALLATLPTADQTTVTVRGSVGAMQFEAADVVAVVHTVTNDDNEIDGDVADTGDDNDGNDGVAATDDDEDSAGVVRSPVTRAGTVVGRAPNQAPSGPPPSAPGPVSSNAGTQAAQTAGVWQSILAYLGYQLEAPTTTDPVVDDTAEQSTPRWSDTDKANASREPGSEKTEHAAREVAKAAEDAPAVNNPDAAESAQPEQSEPAVESLADSDSDGDGVPDYTDMCPGSDAQDAVDTTGCSVAQLCPCDGQPTDRPWRDHRQYVTCVADSVEAFADAGLVSERQRDALIDDAVASSCGPANIEKASEQNNRDGKQHVAARRFARPQSDRGN